MCIRTEIENPIKPIRAVFSIELEDTCESLVRSLVRRDINQTFIFIHILHNKKKEKKKKTNERRIDICGSAKREDENLERNRDSSAGIKQLPHPGISTIASRPEQAARVRLY